MKIIWFIVATLAALSLISAPGVGVGFGTFMPMIRVDVTPTFTVTQTATATSIATSTATTTATATATQPAPGPCPCHADVRNCSDFNTETEAQACMDHCIAQGQGDIHNLDGNANGTACESLPPYFKMIK